MSQFDSVIINNKINSKILSPVCSQSDGFGVLRELRKVGTKMVFLVLVGKV